MSKKNHEGDYGIENFFLKHTEDRQLKPFIDIKTFENNHNLNVFENSNQIEHIAGQPIRIQNQSYEIVDPVVTNYTAFPLILN